MKRVVHIILTVLMAAAVGLLVYSLGRPFAFPWNFHVDLVNPTVVDNADQGFAIVDSSSRRLLLLDNDYRVKGSIEFGNLGSRADRVNFVEMSDQSVYVLATNYHSGGQFISEEMLIEYGYNGDFKKVLATESVPLEEHRTIPAICDIKFADDGSMLIARRSDCRLQVIQATAENNYGTQEVEAGEAVIDQELPSRIYDASISVEKNAVAATTYSGGLYFCTADTVEDITDSVSDIDQMLPSYVSTMSDGSVTFSNSLESELYKFISGYSPSASETLTSGEENVHICDAGTYIKLLDQVVVGGLDDLGTELSVTVVNGDSIYILDESGSVVAQVASCGLAPMLALRIVCTWLSALFLMAIIVLVVIRMGFHHRGWTKLAACMAVALMVCVTVSYSHQTFAQSKATLNSELTSISRFVTQTGSADIGDVMLEARDTQSQSASDYDENYEKSKEVADYLDAYVESSSDQKLNRFYRLFSVSDSGEISVFLDSTDALQCGSPIGIDDFRNHLVDNLDFYKSGGSDTFTFDDSSRTCRYSVSPVFASDGEFVGLCAIGCFYDTELRQQFQNTVDLLMLAAALAAACYLIISQSKVFQKAFDHIRESRANGDDRSAVVQAAHPINFLVTAAIGTDSLLAVVIVSNMAKAAGIDAVIFSASGVLALQAFGSIFGAVISKYMSQKKPARAIFVGASLLTLVALLGCIVGAATNNLPLFFAAKTVSGFSLSGVLAEMIKLFRYQGDPGEQRDAVEKAVRWGNLSSTILSVMVAGYLVDAFGNAAAYVLAFAFVAALLVVGAKVLPKGFCFTDSYKPEKIDFRESKRKALALFKPKMLTAVIVLGLPLVLVVGYNSYLFPLISDGYEMKVVYITNLYVVARAIAYLLRKVPYALLDRGVSEFALGSTSVLVIGLVLVGFFVNKGMLWAIVTLMVLAVMVNLAGACISPIKDSILIEHGFRPKDYTVVVSVVDKILKVVQPVLLGVIVAVGNGPIACAILGIATLVCLAAFVTFLSGFILRTYGGLVFQKCAKPCTIGTL